MELQMLEENLPLKPLKSLSFASNNFGKGKEWQTTLGGKRKKVTANNMEGAKCFPFFPRLYSVHLTSLRNGEVTEAIEKRNLNISTHSTNGHSFPTMI